MQASRKKWLIFGVCAVAVAGGALFFLSVTPGTRTPAKAAAAPVVETPEHELKALAMELEKNPGHTPVLMRMAQLERDKGKLDDALEYLRQAVKADPANRDARLELGRTLYEKGDVGGAIEQTVELLKADPKNVDALYNLGAIYANLGNAGRAREYWRQAVAANANAESGKRARESLARLGGG